MAFTLRQFKSPEEVAKAAAEDWLENLQFDANKPVFDIEVVLSGGRITKTFFSELVRMTGPNSGRYAEILTRCRLHFFWADERCVPPDDPESNYNIARQLLFEPLNIPTERIHRIRGEANEATAVKEVTDAVWTQMPRLKDRGIPFFKNIFLGMGEDGHVASLFPGESEKIMNDPAVYRAVTAVKPPPRRITLGYEAIANAFQVWVLASGPGKEAALRESVSGGNTPLGRVLQMRWKCDKNATRIYTDISLPNPLPDGLFYAAEKV